MGPATGTGFGLTGISWHEIDSWIRITDARLSPWEAETLRMMSQAYAGSFNGASREERSNPPWAKPETLEKRKKEGAESLKSGFRSLMGGGNKK